MVEEGLQGPQVVREASLGSTCYGEGNGQPSFYAFGASWGCAARGVSGRESRQDKRDCCYALYESTVVFRLACTLCM